MARRRSWLERMEYGSGKTQQTMHKLKPTKATDRQVKLIIGLTAADKRSLTPGQLQKLRYATTVAQADALIKKLMAAKTTKTTDISPMIDYIVKLRAKAHQRITAEELAELQTLDNTALRSVQQQAMKAVQEWNDAHGVPIPKWRMVRGFYTEELLERNGSYNMPKVKPQPRKMTFEELKTSLKVTHEVE